MRRGGDRYAEYPCVRRFRHRRLLASLWLQGFGTAAESMLSDSNVMFSVLRLRQLVEGDQWRDAQRYLSRFVPPPPDTAAAKQRPPPQLSVEAMALRLFIGMHRSLANIVAGGGGKENPPCSQYMNHDRTVCHGHVRLRSIILNIFHCRNQVRLKAAEIVRGLAYRTPELKDLVLMPLGMMRPHNVLPIGVGFHRRYPLKKRARRPRAYTVAKLFLGKTRSLPAISDPSQESCGELETESKALDWVADLVDECLKAGKRPEPHQVPLQTSGMEGATVAPVLQTAFSGLTYPAINPGMTSGPNEGNKFASHGAPFLGTVHAPVSQTAFGCLTNRCGNSDVGLMANSGALVAPVSQNMFGTLTGPAETAGMPLVANAETLKPDWCQGQSAGLALTPSAPYLVTMFDAPVPRTVVDCLTSTAENSGLSLMTSAPVAPAMHTTNLASHAENSGALVVPAVQTMNLASHAENSGAPIAPAVQTTDSASHAGNYGITKSFDKEDSNVESAHQGYMPREELSILDELNLYPKRQRATGAFSEASLTTALET